MSRTFLIDANLPIALARALEANGYPARHVFDLGEANSPDVEIWSMAETSNDVIVSKDRDFADLARASQQGPPVIWLRMGNARKHVLVQRFIDALPRIVATLDLGERLIELR